MSNIGRRKCKYFGAASFSFLVFLFIFFETLELLNFSAPSFSFLSASVQMPSLCALCSRLSFWILLFSHQTTYWGKKKKTDRQEQEGGREKKKENVFTHLFQYPACTCTPTKLLRDKTMAEAHFDTLTHTHNLNNVF